MHNIFHSICAGNNTLKTLIKSIYIHFRHYSKHYCSKKIKNNPFAIFFIKISPS